MKRTTPVFNLTTQTVDSAFAKIQMQIPQKDALCEELTRRRLAPMAVRAVPKADFVTPELETFLRFLKVNSIRTAMFHYEYYDEHQLDLMFRLPETNINLFERRPVGTRNGFGSYQPEESDYVNYLNYTEYVKRSVNPTLPRVLWLYALCQGHAVACRLEDDWLARTGLPTVQTLMQSAANCRKYGNYEQGIIRFSFEYIGDTKPQNSGNASDESRARNASAPQADPDEAYKRILSNIEKGRYH